MAKVCCIPICRNAKAGTDESVGLHPFPANDEELRAKWIQFVGCANPGRFRWRMRYICSEHFVHSELTTENGQPKLLEGAVPMIFVTESNEEEDTEEDVVMVSEVRNPASNTTVASKAEAPCSTMDEIIKLRSLFCRICIRKRTDLFPLSSKLHNVTLADIVFITTGIKLDTVNILPDKVCSDCVGKLDLAFNVRLDFIHKEKVLKNLLDGDQLENYYKSYDNHRFKQQGFNEHYLQNLIANAKAEKKFEPVQASETIVKHEAPLDCPESPLQIPEESIEYLDEALCEEADLTGPDDNQLHPQMETENKTSDRKPFASHDNSANRLKAEASSGSEEEGPKFVYSWKELYKPKSKPRPKSNTPKTAPPKPVIVPNTCYICDTVHADPDALDAHMVDHIDLLPYSCDCGTEEYPQVFRTLVSANKHRQSHLYPYKCDHCPLRFLNSYNNNAHFKDRHAPRDATDGYTCDYCGQHFRLRRPFKCHLAKHQAVEDGRYKCEFCEKVFGNSSLLKRHRRIHTGEKPYECKHCGRRFNHEANFLSHKRIHTGEKGYICQECGKNFTNSTSLRYHMAEHFPDDPQYRIQTSIKKQRYPETLRDAESKVRLTTSGQKLYICNVEGCGFETLLYRQHFYHQHMHKKRFKCDKCDRRFPFRSTLQKHVEFVHEGKTLDRNLACPYCSKLFNHKQKLQLHIDTHEDNRRYKCSFCTKSFVQRANCRAHERIHTGERPYPCRVCSAAFITSSGRKKHEATHKDIIKVEVEQTSADDEQVYEVEEADEYYEEYEAEPAQEQVVEFV
ncbi:zinc finger protein 678-like [Uranotaenia lowii]|uniref:zinc finger protein 678-like n=1 Tax=Uranotaenia lowii TaxID=190385 RepID=UPI00247AF9F7|nr:zinc finger protein 678-like [Uranotaenia lowii]